mmetsp:Transcript_7975/g.22672  ORF Transcript_7975/g.22672 Transcript_7975/m.22672 type:complete len:104 (+) Transcript_7975:336-647(+)
MEGSVEARAREDEYYRELLARVDNAIVETREADATAAGPARCCRTCVQRALTGAVVLAAFATEGCLTLRHVLFSASPAAANAGSVSGADATSAQPTQSASFDL